MTRTRHFALTALCTVAAACASGTPSNDIATDSSAPTPTTRSTARPSGEPATTSPLAPPPTGHTPPTSTATTPASTDPSASPASTEVAATAGDLTTGRYVVSVLDESPATGGWTLEAGLWRSSAFDPPLRFETSTELVAIEQSREALTLVSPSSRGNASITLLVPLAVGGAENRPVALPGDFEAYIQELERLDVVTIAQFDRLRTPSGDEVELADFTVHTPAGFEPLPCRLGPDCLWVMRTQEGGDVHARVGAPVRVVARDIDGTPVRMVATADDDATFAGVADAALSIAMSVTADPEAPPPTDGLQFLSSISPRESILPAGRYATRLGDVGVTLALDDDLPGFAVRQVEVDFVVFEVQGVGAVSIVSPDGYGDPAAAQVNSQERAGRLLDEPPRDASSYGEWLDRFFAIEGSETTSIGGFPATGWYGDFDDRTPYYECGPPIQDFSGGRCVSLYTTSVGWWYTSYVDVDTDHDGFNWFVDGPDVLVNIGADDSRSDDDLWEAVAPLIDAISFDVDRAG